MSESRIKQLWRNRISHQFSTCLTKPDTVSVIHSPLSSPPPAPPMHNNEPLIKTRRKPLPDDCPAFDFTGLSEKTLAIPTNPLEEKLEIPTRNASRNYDADSTEISQHKLQYALENLNSRFRSKPNYVPGGIQ